MNSLNLLFFIGLASSVFSFPAVENENYNNFDYHNISVAIGTNWVSQLNITEVSKVNDPNAKLILYNNISQIFHLPESEPKYLHIDVIDRADVYEKEPETFYNEVRDAWTIEDGNVDISISLGSFGTVLRNVDFSDFTKRSYIDYNVTYTTVVNITYPYEKSIEQVHQQYPELTKIQMPQLGNDVSGLIPLVNGTGNDDTSCKWRICTTSTNHSKKLDTYYLFDSVTVINSLDVNAGSMSFIRNNVDGKSLYSSILFINLQYKAVIGEHRC